MTPEELQVLKEELALLTARVNAFESASRFNFTKNIDIPKEIGVKIATDSNQKLAFWGATPIVRPATISNPTGGANIDAEARTAINTLIDRLQVIGLIP